MSRICIYPPSATDFSTNGEGLLTPTECTVSEQAAGLYQLTLTHPIDDTLRWMQLQTGWIIKAPCPVRESPEVVEEIIPEGTTTTTTTSEIYSVTGGSVRLRKGAGTNYSTLAILHKDDKVKKLDGSTNSWMHVCTVDGGATGYMSARYLALDSTQNDTISAEKGSTIIVPAQARDQLFRITSVETDSESGTVTATAYHVFYDWSGNILNSEYTPENDDVQTAIGKLKNGLLTESEIELFASTASGTISGDYSYKNPVEILLDPDEGIVTQTGAQVLRDNFNVYVYPDYVRDRGVTIRRGKNLIGVVGTLDDGNVVTRIIPVGSDKNGNPLYLDGQKYIDSARISDYPTVRARRIEYDVEVGDKFKTAQAARAELRRLAEEEFSNGIDLPTYGMEVDFVLLRESEEYANYASLQAVHLYDTVSVIDETVGIEAKIRVTGYEWDALAEQYNSLTLGNLEELAQTVYGYQLANSSVSGTKIINGSVSGAALRSATIQYAKIATAAIEQLNTNSISAVTAKIQDITANSLTTDELYAAVAEMVALKVGSLTAEDISTDSLAAGLAAFTVLTCGTAEFDRATVAHLVANAMNLEFGTADEVFIRNLSVEYAQMVGAAIGNLCIRASDGKYYEIDVDDNGNVIATNTTLTEGEISAGETESGRVILETSITAENLNTANLLATYALINRIDAARIDVDTLLAREAFINKLITSQIFADGSSLEIVAAAARSAQTTADNAQTAAAKAQTVADAAVPYVEFQRVIRINEDGLHVGDNQSGGEVLIDSESVNVVMSGQKYSRFAANYVQFGRYQLRKSADGGLVFKLQEE